MSEINEDKLTDNIIKHTVCGNIYSETEVGELLIKAKCYKSNVISGPWCYFGSDDLFTNLWAEGYLRPYAHPNESADRGGNNPYWARILHPNDVVKIWEAYRKDIKAVNDGCDSVCFLTFCQIIEQYTSYRLDECNDDFEIAHGLIQAIECGKVKVNTNRYVDNYFFQLVDAKKL